MMTTHEEAIEFFKARGIQAIERTWTLGHTVQVYWGRFEEEERFYAYRELWCLMPRDGAWVAFRGGGVIPDANVTLDEACQQTLAAYEAWKQKTQP